MASLRVEYSRLVDKAARLAIALVWLYNGLWCKLLARCSSHEEIIASAAVPLGFHTRLVMVGIGAGEVMLAVWVLSGRKLRLAAWVQTLVLVAMNGAGLAWGAEEIPNLGALLVQNLVFLTLVWIVGRQPRGGSLQNEN